MTEEVDLDALKEKAKVLAEATGRTEADVLADLLDDGVLNESNKAGSDGDLISELKRAAELIGTVQQVNKQVSQNSVLNGGQNKTDVKIETTLEGDIVDRAIESAQRKADAIKKLAATIVPVLLLFGGGGTLEAMGVIDIFGSDDDSDRDHDYHIEVDIWGCTDPEATNFDEWANIDDGSCYYDDPDDGCGVVYSYSDPYLRFRDGSSNNLEVVWELEHDKSGDDCTVEIEFMLSLYYEGQYQGSAEYHEMPRTHIPSHPVERILQHDIMTDLGDGNWSVEARWKYANGNEDGCCIMTNTIEVGEPDDSSDGTCTPFFYSVNAIREVDGYNNTIIIGSFDVDWDGNDCSEYEAEIKVEMEPHTCDEDREWIHYDELIYLTKGQDGDIEEIEWNMTATESYWSCVDVLFRIVVEPNDYETRWVEDI